MANLLFHIYTLNSHAFQISWANFSPSNIPRFLIQNTSAVSLPAYGYDLGSILLLWFLFLTFCIVFPISAPHRLLFVCRLPVCGISVQNQCDTCIPISYELNYLRPFLGSPVLFYLWFCRPTFILAQEFILLSKDLLPCIAGGLFLLLHKKASKHRFPGI